MWLEECLGTHTASNNGGSDDGDEDDDDITAADDDCRVTKESEKTEESDFKVEASKSSTGKISKVSGKDSKT